MNLHSFHVDVDGGDLLHVKRALGCRSVSGGSELVQEYETRLAGTFGVRHALAFSSGTTAMHGTLAALGIGPGDEVILSPAGTIESVLAVLYQNAIPVFADVQPHRFDFDLDDLLARIGPRTKAVVAVPMWGYPMNVEAVASLCEPRGVRVVEDIALSAGASIAGKKLGTFGAAACASTHERKLISTGEGGFTLTNDDGIADRMREIQRYGMVYRRGPGWDAIRRRAGHVLGWNYKANAFTAAFGISQLGKLDEKIRKRVAHARTIVERLSDHPAAAPYDPVPGGETNGYALVVRLRDGNGITARDFGLALKAEGVVSDTLEYGYQPLYEYPLLRRRIGYGLTDCPFSCARYGHDYRPSRCPNAEEWTRSIITLPTHEALTESQIDHICRSFRKVVQRLGLETAH
jgi:perosamine synthetase